VEESTLGLWLRRRFIAGFFVTVPLVLSITALVWIFGIIDGFTAPLSTRLVGRAAPGVGLALMLLFVLAIGTVATNVIGRRMLARETWLARVPIFRTIHACEAAGGRVLAGMRRRRGVVMIDPRTAARDGVSHEGVHD
jgi:uncharacterized membrane protein